LLFPGQPDTIESNVVEVGAAESGDVPPGPSPIQTTASRHCTAIKADGRPCGGLAQRNTTVCLFHDETRADEAAAARRLGGQHRRRVWRVDLEVDFNGLGTADAIRSIIERAVIDILDLEPSIARSRVLIAAAVAAMRLLEVTNLASEVASLKAALRAGGLLPSTAPIDIEASESDLPELDA
jgi:hypothetical protein